MKNLIFAALCSVLLAGCGSSDSKTEGKDAPVESVEKNNWNEGSWDEINWQ